MNIYYDEICRGENVRENLIELKKICKTQAGAQELAQTGVEPSVLESLLADEDAKVRKNAALLIGALGFADSAQALYNAYCKEETLFVRSAYLTACRGMDVTAYLPQLKARYNQLCDEQMAIEEEKHLAKERSELRKLLSENGLLCRHTFHGWCRRNDVIFTTERPLREGLQEQIRRRAKDELQIAVHPFGVRVRTCELPQLSRLHTYRELLYVLNIRGTIAGDAQALADALLASNLILLLEVLHKEPAPFCFRVELRGMADAAQKAQLAKSLAAAIERGSGGRLQNSTTDYEVELRLTQTKDGSFFPCLKLYTQPDERFRWRKQISSASMHPYLAASMLELVHGYLSDDAVVLDALCGVGTFVIERNLRQKTYDCYGVDIFGEAVKGARENAAAAGVDCNFITKDFTQFTSKHKMTEIYADMPRRGKEKDGLDALYAGCFARFTELLSEHGHVFLYATEEGMVKKHLRLNKSLVLLRQYPIRPSENGVLYVIGNCGV